MFLVRESLVFARMDAAGVTTSIPNTASGPGAFATKMMFGTVNADTTGTIADIANGRMNIIAGFNFCRVGYTVAFDLNSVGWRGVRIKNSLGQNYGNQRLLAVASDATTNPSYTTPWLKISKVANAAPSTVMLGDYFELWPAQTSGGNLNAGADTASSWFHIEFKN